MEMIQASVPLFFGLIVLELLWVVARERGGYRFSDSITDLSCGILSQLSGVVLKVGFLAGFLYVTEHWSIQRVLPIPGWPEGSPFQGVDHGLGFVVQWPELASWVTVFLLVDLAYYWLHRLSHEVHILWAGHVVHHSSEEYNLTVALRQSSLHGLMSWVFYLPLALLGVPWLLFAVCHGLNLIYQFWIHTREIGRLGPLEAVMNTPSHHRVHHGVNPEYQDKNYAGVFIVWDKLFGTFVPERAEPVYGITVPLQSWNPLWANVHVFAEIWRTVRMTKRWQDKIRIVFGAPSWRPADVGPCIVTPPVSRETFEKFERQVPGTIRWYVTIHFIAVLVAGVWVLRLLTLLPALQAATVVFYVILSLSNLGALLEGKRWGFLAEGARLIVLTVVAGLSLVRGTGSPAWMLGLGVGAVLSVGWLLRTARMTTWMPAV